MGKRFVFIIRYVMEFKRWRTGYRALKFGRFQAEDIYQQYNKAVEDKNADLVIALAHHPLDWLTGKEQSIAQGNCCQ